MTDTEAVFEQLKHQIDRARDSGTSLQTLARQKGPLQFDLVRVAGREDQSPMIRVAEALGQPIEFSDGKPREEDHPSRKR